MHNLGTVIKFEILKQIRKPLFWVAIFIFPLLTVVFGAISYFSTSMAIEQDTIAQNELKDNLSSVIIVDQTGLVNQNMFSDLKTKTMTDPDSALAEFKASGSQKTALVIYPADIVTDTIQTYTKLGDNQAITQQVAMGFNSLARQALVASVSTQIEPQIAAILTTQELNTSQQILDNNGEIYSPFEKMIVPGIFLVLLFIIFTLTGNQTLVATTEEKENRVAEMILTTIEARALIVGKIIALVALGFIQITALAAPMILIYLAGAKLDLIPPFLDSILASAKVEFWPIFIGANGLVWGFLLMTGFTILVGSLFPTAQDATQFYTPIVLGMIIPLYFAGAIFTGAKTIVVQILTFFPLTAPFTLLMRNTAGNLSSIEGLLGLTILVASAIVIMLIAVRTFRQGVFEYSKPTSLKDAFKRQVN